MKIADYRMLSRQAGGLSPRRHIRDSPVTTLLFYLLLFIFWIIFLCITANECYWEPISLYRPWRKNKRFVVCNSFLKRGNSYPIRWGMNRLRLSVTRLRASRMPMPADSWPMIQLPITG